MTAVLLATLALSLAGGMVAFAWKWHGETVARTAEHLKMSATFRALSAERDEARATAARVELELSAARKALEQASRIAAAGTHYVAERRKKEILDAPSDDAAVWAAAVRVLQDIADQRAALAAAASPDHREPEAAVQPARTEAAPTVGHGPWWEDLR